MYKTVTNQLPDTTSTIQKKVKNRSPKHGMVITTETKDKSLKKYDKVQCNDKYENMVITVSEIEEAIQSLKPGKAGGYDRVCTEHLRYAGKRLCVILSLCLTQMCSHGFIPSNLMKTLIVPLVKNKAGDLQDKNNYRPIALTASVSKVFEKKLLIRCKQKLTTTSNQFGFKKSHSTDLCIFTLKELLSKYTSRSSPVFLCYLDASKAYDRVSHTPLFKILLDRGIPTFILRLLAYWYDTQTMSVQWGSTKKYFFMSLMVLGKAEFSPRHSLMCI